MNCKQCQVKMTSKYSVKFCSRSCAAKYNNHKRRNIRNCLYCCKEISTKKFCNHKCQTALRRKEIFSKIENGDTSLDSRVYKSYLITKKGEKCQLCGWKEVNPFTGNVPIELEHVDGDSSNNTLSNLKLLCPSCHSLTKTYKGANKGNGRHSRMIRYREGKSY